MYLISVHFTYCIVVEQQIIKSNKGLKKGWLLCSQLNCLVEQFKHRIIDKYHNTGRPFRDSILVQHISELIVHHFEKSHKNVKLKELGYIYYYAQKAQWLGRI